MDHQSSLDWRQLEFHPLANAYPIDGEGLEDIRESIQGVGFNTLTPIVLYEMKILDGRKRFISCRDCGVEPSFAPWEGQCGDPASFVFAMNDARLHLDKSQRALALGRLIEAGDGAQYCAPGIRARLQAMAAKHGISARSIYFGREVARGAVPEIISLVEGKEVTVSDAAKVSGEDKDVQQQAAKRVKDGKAKTLTGAVKQLKAVGEAWEGAEPEAPDAPDMDTLGNEIPEHLRGIFKSSIFADSVAQLRTVKNNVRSIAGLSPWFMLMPVQEAIEEAAKMIEKNAPHSICQACKGEGPCDSCRSSGWIPRWRYEEIE